MLAIILMFLNNFSFFQFIFRTSNLEMVRMSTTLVYMNTGEYIINILATLLMTISVIATIFSGWDYIKNGKDLLKD